MAPPDQIIVGDVFSTPWATPNSCKLISSYRLGSTLSLATCASRARPPFKQKGAPFKSLLINKSLRATMRLPAHDGEQASERQIWWCTDRCRSQIRLFRNSKPVQAGWTRSQEHHEAGDAHGDRSAWSSYSPTDDVRLSPPMMKWTISQQVGCFRG